MASQLPRSRLSPELILRLQATAGNRAVLKLLERSRMAALESAASPPAKNRFTAWWRWALTAARGWWRKAMKNE